MNARNDTQRPVGRFAPSPTGPLHIGSLVAAVGSYCLARQDDGLWLVRMEDLDTPRVVPGADGEILRTLEGLGFEWDGEVVYQSRRTQAYEEAAHQLRRKGLLFDCGCSRREILASAPHPGEEGPVYPGTCREGLPAGRLPRSLRIRVPDARVCFSDGVFGDREQHLKTAVGDFVVRRADGLFAYQLAVVIDDIAAGVNQVVRGADLLSSTPRQIFLYACLGFRAPRYVHLPLVVAEDGEKVSKRHGSVSDLPFADGGTLLWRVMRFLGQEIPAEMSRACAPEVLRWGIENFHLDAVPDRDGLWPFDAR